MKKFIKLSDLTLFDLLFVLIVTGITAAIAIPTLLSSRKSADELSALANLRAIQAAQFVYYTKLGNKTYASFDQLSDAGLLDGAFRGAGVVKNNYALTESVNASSTAYCAKASPVLTAGETKYFGINQKGVAYQSNAAADIDCTAGNLTIGGSAVPVLR